ncbi:MAG: hypothetical protein WAL66_17325 [Nitrososphaeraceae archaeon]
MTISTAATEPSQAFIEAVKDFRTFWEPYSDPYGIGRYYSGGEEFRLRDQDCRPNSMIDTYP